jgi:hypothetical protein
MSMSVKEARRVVREMKVRLAKLPYIYIRTPMHVFDGGRGSACPICGRSWRPHPEHGSVAGFLRAAASNHVYSCIRQTPEERRAVAIIDLDRWKKKPPLHFIHVSLIHPGFKDEPS